MKKTLLRVLPVFLLLSCEKRVEIKPKTVEPKLVVEATIENGQPPLVILSKSLNYFSEITPSILTSHFVTNAEVFVSNGIKTHHLKLYTITAGGGNNLYYYSTDSSSLSTAFDGEINRTYFLRIQWEGKEYTATTRIPLPNRRIDSLFWKQPPSGNSPEKVLLMLRAFDPPGYGDYVRYFTRRNREPFFPGLNSVYDDQVIDGTIYEVQVERGIARNGSIPDQYSFFDKGDTVTLKLCNIDKATYDFWRSMEYTYASVGNPFSSPTKVLSNISGSALGYFGGYAAQFRTIIIPR